MIHTYVAVEYKLPYNDGSYGKETRSMIVDYPIRTTSDVNDLQKDISQKFNQNCPIIFMKEFEDN